MQTSSNEEICGSKRFSFVRNDGIESVVVGDNPEHAWTNLCITFDDDRMYLYRYMRRYGSPESQLFTERLSKGFEYLNNWINGGPGVEYGPIYKELGRL